MVMHPTDWLPISDTKAPQIIKTRLLREGATRPQAGNGEQERILIRCREALTNEQGEAVVILKVRRTASELQREFPFGTRLSYTLEKNVLILSSNVYSRYHAYSLQ